MFGTTWTSSASPSGRQVSALSGTYLAEITWFKVDSVKVAVRQANPMGAVIGSLAQGTEVFLTRCECLQLLAIAVPSPRPVSLSSGVG